MRRTLVWGWSALGALALASPALAQNEKRFEVQLTARATYDDNVSRSNAQVAMLRGLEQEDVFFSPTVSLDILQPIGRQALFLNGDVGYEIYQENDQLNREKIALQGGAIATLSSCMATIKGVYNRQQSELDDLTSALTENVETVTSVGADAICGGPVGLAPTLSVSQEWAENSAAARATSDYNSTTVVAGLSYRRPTFGDLNVFGHFVRTEYDNRLVPVGAGMEKDGYDSVGAGVRYTRRIGARLEGSASAGYASVESSTGAMDDFEGMTYALDLTFRPSSRIQAQALFERAVSPSNRLFTTYVLDESYVFRGTYKLGSRITLGLTASLVDSEFETQAIAPLLFPTEEQMKTVSASVRFDMSDRLGFLLEAAQQERDANVHGLDYTANRVGLSIVATY